MVVGYVSSETPILLSYIVDFRFIFTVLTLILNSVVIEGKAEPFTFLEVILNIPLLLKDRSGA